jgi:pilus assembly protein Flp/PilA
MSGEKTNRTGYRRLNQENIMTFIKNMLRNEDGATAIEYGLIAALVGIAATAGFSSLGTAVSSSFSGYGTSI